MKINVISDVHLDFADCVLPGGDILIISGDLCEAVAMKKEMYNPNMVLLEHERKDQRPDRFYRFIEEECSKKYAQTIYVMGNHEYYGSTYQRVWSHLNNQMPDNVHLLEDETLELDGVTFVGATLWTDMNGADPLTLYTVKQTMSDYTYVKMFNESKNAYHKLIPEFTVQQHFKSRDYIKSVVEAAPEKKFVVVTHHAPCKASVKPQYAGDVLMNGAYSSDLSEFIMDHPQIVAMIHGHTHSRFKYQLGNTWILCNPRGYKGHEMSAEDFRPRSFDIDSSGAVTFDEDDWT